MPKRNGTSNAETLVGTDKRDIIKGFGGDDLLVGRGGADIIFGGAGADSISAGDGRDLIFGSRGADQIAGGRGYDTLSYKDAGGGVQLLGATIVSYNFSEAPDFGTNWAAGQQIREIEKLVLSDQNDRAVFFVEEITVFGGKGDDFIVGGSESYGGRGKDVIDGGLVYGGRGNDTLSGVEVFGGRGRDTIDALEATGGRGADTFVFDDAPSDSTILDFNDDQNDRIVFNIPFAQSEFGFINFTAMFRDTMDIDGTATVIWDGGSLTIEGYAKEDLLEEWFVFEAEDSPFLT